MPPDLPDPFRTATSRGEQIAVIHRRHAAQLERRVARSTRADRAMIEDACSFAWLQLLTHSYVEVGAPSSAALGWLARTAASEVWRLEAIRARTELLDHVAIERELGARDRAAPDVHELVAQHVRLGLVRQLPERPRRFLLRLAIGHSYREIAAQENASLTTTNKQIARAKRLLRACEMTGQEAAL